MLKFVVLVHISKYEKLKFGICSNYYYSYTDNFIAVKILRLKHCYIDFSKSDDCIKHSPSGRIYAMSWYLNVVSPGWLLLIADDYSIIMPLPVKSRYKLNI